MNANAQDGASASLGRGLARGLLVLGFALTPTLLAIALTPGFSTQDGPAHIYSARILNASLTRGSPYQATFRVAWEPLPNWVGHLVTMGAVAVFSPEVANRLMTATTLVAVAGAIVWLRWVVAGSRGIEVAAGLAALLTLNVTWLLGFTSFLLGVAVGVLTLGIWWSSCDRWDLNRAVGLGSLLTLGYFCHPISLGLTVGGMLVLVGSRWGRDLWRTAVWTASSLIPLIPLALTYGWLTRSGGQLLPVWDHWTPSIAGMVSQIGWVDPLSLAAKTTRPLPEWTASLPGPLLIPALWAVAGLVGLIVTSWRRCESARSGWLIIATALIGLGLVAPDTLGVKHGHFLPQRIVLFGLIALVPWLDLSLTRVAARGAVGCLGMALILQSAFVWDYARSSRARVEPFLRVAPRFEAGIRVGTLLNAIRGRFRANPLLHADCLIAAATDSVCWTNYETAQYYFPVKVRSSVDHPVATTFEEVAILDEPRDARRRAQLWSDLLRAHGTHLDQIVEWGTDPMLDAMTSRDYRVTTTAGPLRIWSRITPISN